jgi:hypothetical protein
MSRRKSERRPDPPRDRREDREDHVKRTTKAALLTMLVLSTPALAQTALPHVKTGQCSGGYRESGGFCVPKSERSAPAVPKVGQCPGWASGAHYCTRMAPR